MGRWRRGRWRQRFNRGRWLSGWAALRWRRRFKMKEFDTRIMDVEGSYWSPLNDLLKRRQEASSQGLFDLQLNEALEARFQQYCHAQILRHLYTVCV